MRNVYIEYLVLNCDTGLFNFTPPKMLIFKVSIMLCNIFLVLSQHKNVTKNEVKGIAKNAMLFVLLLSSSSNRAFFQE